MIKYFDIKIPGCFLNLWSKLFIGPAGLKVSWWVVMAEYNIDRIFFQSFFEYNSWVSHCACNTSLADDLEMIDFIGPV